MRIPALLTLAFASAAFAPSAGADAIGPITNLSVDACIAFEGESLEISVTSRTALSHLYAVVPAQAPVLAAFIEMRSTGEADVPRDVARVLHLKRKVRADKPNVRSVSVTLAHSVGPGLGAPECPAGQARLAFIFAKELVPASVCSSLRGNCRVTCSGEACTVRSK